MKQETITQITAEWIQMTYRTLDLKRIPSLELRDLFKRTYEVLHTYHRQELVPKEMCEMLLEMDGFFYFASMITDKEFDDDPSFYQAAHAIGEALKTGFFESRYECEYPLLMVQPDEKEKPHTLDLENGFIEDLF